MAHHATHSRADGEKGDWIEVHGLPGLPPRRGQILEVLGRPGHVHYRVRWDERHESIFYPSEGAHIVQTSGDPEVHHV
jgi:uncharacterized protein DUF1918